MTALLTWDFFRTWYGQDDLAQSSSLEDQFNLANPAVGALFEAEMGRPVFEEERTEYFDTSERRQHYYLRAFPVVSIASVELDPQGRFTGGEYEVDVEQYRLLASTGRLTLNEPSGPAINGLKVVYTGGLAADQAALLTATHQHHVLAVLAAQQVKVMLERIDSVGLQSHTQGRGNQSFLPQDPLSPEIAAALSRYRVGQAV